MAVELLGEITADTLEWALRRCAQNLPGDNKPDSQCWGGGAASEVFREIAGTPLHSIAVRVLEDFYRRGTPDEIALATTFTPPDQIAIDAIEDALRRGDLAPSTRESVESALGRCVSCRPSLYHPGLRAHVGRPGWSSLLGAMIIVDHAWLLANLPAIFGSDPREAAFTIYSGVQPLNAAEGRALRAELDGQRAALGDAVVDVLLECIDQDPDLPGRAGPVRWAP